jgi:outer membrane receptor protein involved in Fe transport
MYSLQQDFSGDFYQKHQIGASMELKLQMDTRIHLWITTMSIEYDANFSYQWSDMEPKGPVFPAIFQESNDRVLFKTEYRLRYFQALFDQRKWYYTDPFVEFSIETELTRGSRPDLSDDALFLSGVNERFRHLAFNLKVGFSFQIIDQLNLKIGFNLQKTHPSEVVVNYIPHMIEQPPTSVLPGQPGQVIRDDYSKLSINTNLTLGGSIEYELEKIKLFSIANTPFSWGSQAEYRFNIQTGNKDRLNFIHYLRWTNSFGFDIMGQFSLAFGFRLYLLQDIFRPFPNAPTFVQGPWGVRIEPFIRLNFEWATRGQLS